MNSLFYRSYPSKSIIVFSYIDWIGLIGLREKQTCLEFAGGKMVISMRCGWAYRIFG
jgi:hypothetical protein